jgi:putative ATPase
MIEGGEDPKFIARRMIIFASEDIGNADPLAFLVANAAFEAVERVGLPECIINLSQAVTYLATAPKSNASYLAYIKAAEDAKSTPFITIPASLRDSHYKGAEILGHGKEYKYPHYFPGHFYPESLMPEELKGKIYYQPTDQGFERKIKERLQEWRRLIEEKGSE